MKLQFYLQTGKAFSDLHWRSEAGVLSDSTGEGGHDVLGDAAHPGAKRGARIISGTVRGRNCSISEESRRLHPRWSALS